MVSKLLNSAKKLNNVSNLASDNYFENATKMANMVNEQMLNRPNIKNLVGDNLEMMKDNHSNHARFIGSILKEYNPSVFVETVLWVFRAYRSHGFTSNYWATQLNIWITVIENVLEKEAYQEIYPYYEWMLVNVPLFVKVSDETIENSDLLH